MKKKISMILLSLVMIFNTCTIIGYADSGITVTLNGSKIDFDVQPQLINNRTMVPLRKIFEAMDIYVEWDANTQTVSAADDNTIITAKINDYNLYVNGIPKLLDVPPMIVDGRTLVPARFIAESFGGKVDWNGTTKTVAITTIPSLTFLSDPSGYFEMNSANGVEITWGAKKTSQKTINYYTINYTFINPVGDLAYDEITDSAKRSKKFVGPIKIGECIIDYGIIGYVPACHTVRIDSVYLEFADGTTELVNCGQCVYELKDSDASIKSQILHKILD